MEDLRKALDIIAFNNAEGIVSDEVLIKACDSFKVKSEDFLDDYSYHVQVTKSLYDHINNIEPDAEVCKAIVPGQTKVIDGVVYIYTATPGAKTQYDWRVFKGKQKNIGKQVSDDKVDDKQKYVNELFPQDLNSLKVIKKLGGSTGAQLVEDSKGNQFVMKKGGSTSNEHVKSEYYANQLYDLLGLRVPDFELYEENGEAVMLSKFIPMTSTPSVKDYDKMAEGFVIDALLANWDIYQNDNCLLDSAGRIIRVDNGGSLSFRAQGGKKNFGRNVDDFESMKRYNPSVVANLKTDDYIKQIDDVLKRRDDVVNFLNSSSETSSLSKTFSHRFDSLERIKKDLEAEQAKKNKKAAPRSVKPDSEMYRDFTEEEIKEIWDNANGSKYYKKLFETNYTVGWELLSKICEERGFTERPRVVGEEDYFDLIEKGVKYQMFRGVSNGGGKSGDFYADHFKHNDNCFFGTIGIYGSGIYAHVNDGTRNKDNTKNGYRNSDAYKAARGYAGNSGAILECALEPNAKVAKVEDLKQEILKLVTFDTEAVKDKQQEIDDLTVVLSDQEHTLDNITEVTEDDVKRDMHWDEDTLVMHQVDIDNVDWGAVDDEGNPDYPDFETFVKGNLFSYVTANGGSVREKGKDTDVFVFTLPNSKEKFMLSRFQWENNAIKRKNGFSKPYNYPLRRFQDWLMKEHYTIINKEVASELNKLGDKVTDLQGYIKQTKIKLNDLHDELKDLKKPKNPDGDMMSGIYQLVSEGSLEAVGTYAALKGYDALIQPRGNGGPNSFMIILNRSKVVVKQ